MASTAEQLAVTLNAIAKGNPGALNVLFRLFNDQRGDVIETIQKLELSPEEIWMLYKDESGEDLDTFIGRIIGLRVARGIK